VNFSRWKAGYALESLAARMRRERGSTPKTVRRTRMTTRINTTHAWRGRIGLGFGWRFTSPTYAEPIGPGNRLFTPAGVQITIY
jgi:hypothetical protein